ARRSQRIDGSSSRSGECGSAAQKGPAGKLHGMAPKVVAATIFGQLCQFSGASTDARLTVLSSCACTDARIVAAQRAEAKLLLLLPGGRFGRLRGGACGGGFRGLRGGAGIRGLRQRGRIVRLGVQERDHVGALAAARQPRKAHLGARREGLRIGEELVEIIDSPVAPLALERRRIVEPFLRLRAPADAVEVRADAVRLAFAESMAGGALLRRVRALVHGRAGEQLFDRFVRLLGRRAAGGWFGRRN